MRDYEIWYFKVYKGNEHKWKDKMAWTHFVLLYVPLVLNCTLRSRAQGPSNNEKPRNANMLGKQDKNDSGSHFS